MYNYYWTDGIDSANCRIIDKDFDQGNNLIQIEKEDGTRSEVPTNEIIPLKSLQKLYDAFDKNDGIVRDYGFSECHRYSIISDDIQAAASLVQDIPGAEVIFSTGEAVKCEICGKIVLAENSIVDEEGRNICKKEEQCG